MSDKNVRGVILRVKIRYLTLHRLNKVHASTMSRKTRYEIGSGLETDSHSLGLHKESLPEITDKISRFT